MKQAIKCKNCNKKTLKSSNNQKYCSICKKQYKKLYWLSYYQKNRNYLIKKAKNWNNKNRKRANKNWRKWAENNREYENLKVKNWRKRNPEKVKLYNREYRKRRRNIDLKFRLDGNISSAIYHTLKENKAGRKWEVLVGYTIEDLIKHLEPLFDKNMNWENYGNYWEIDHIKPKSLFNYICAEDEEFKKCWSLNNLQPMEKIENNRKSNKFKKPISS